MDKRNRGRERHPERNVRSSVDVGIAIEQDNTRWISAKAVADIWNYRARVEYDVPGTNYTRFSVRSRRPDQRQKHKGETSHFNDADYELPSIETALGRLYSEEKAWTIPLHPRVVKRDLNQQEYVTKDKRGRFTSSEDIS